ncbi:MAG: antibiotic biosynthesis monooxygenase [Acidimicrobiaceae bacterium]|nr:antibiotic biosynthesis monooxygenase [Acidimicrobiaceae bacterium]|tara:strand:+ start:16209 stop:16517 length:309 start_codon:yes stop_codon:yes gene_type:complete
MSIVRINAITVPEGSGDELLKRFEARLGEVENMDGFENFELLRPADGDTWYVYTRWASEEAFLAWVRSPAFARGHAEASSQPVAHGSELLEFDVVLQAEATT